MFTIPWKPCSRSRGILNFLGKAEDAATCGYAAWAIQSTGEKLAVALALNGPEWLAKMGYTIAEAIEKTDGWLPPLRIVKRPLKERRLV